MEKILEKIPSNLIEKIEKQYGKEILEEILRGFTKKKKVSFRVNPLKASKEEIINELKNRNIVFEEVSWYEYAFSAKNITEKDIEELDIYKDGKIYLQNLSSMLPPILLNPEEKIDILDMTAAPGGKTTEIAALTNNNAYITACEMNKIRADRLRFNLKMQDAKAVVIEKDARNLDDFLKFDKILLDAPCSGSGTIYVAENSKEILYIENFANKLENTQTKLLEKAIKLLKKNEEMVYSTCSILERENENIVKKFLDKGLVEVVNDYDNKFENIKKLPCKINGAICVMPDENYEGFFMVKLRKK